MSLATADVVRAVAGAAIAAGIAIAARRADALSRSGAFAATVVGTLATLAGWGWAAVLVAWFVASSALSRLGVAQKARRTAATLPAPAGRTAVQVWANGGLFALAASAGTLLGGRGGAALHVVALGALAAAAADTWATEIGLWRGGAPRSILTGRPLEAGISGGVTAAGLLGAAAGALAVAAAAPLLLAHVPTVPSAAFPADGSAADTRVILAVATAGLAGSLGDSLLGASCQLRRRCARCDRLTERATHDCGTATDRAGGWGWMTNDTVNALATFIGGGAALLLSP